MRSAWLLLCVGCNEVYGLDPTMVRPGSDVDLDFDGLADDHDPCVASASDADEDTDNDGEKNATDPCPLDTTGTTDGDRDGIFDVCDPFPSMAGDRRTCTMTFVNADLNRQFWHQLGGTGDEWDFINGHLESRPPTSSSLVPELDLDSAPSSTLDASMFAGADIDSTKTVRIWLRTADATATDPACELSGDRVATRLAIVANGAVVAMQSTGPYPAGNAFRMIATRNAQGRVTCTLNRNGLLTTVSGDVAPRVGRFGFYFDGGGTDASIRVEALAIYERD